MLCRLSLLTGSGILGGKHRWSPSLCSGLMSGQWWCRRVAVRRWVDVTEMWRGRIFTLAEPYGGAVLARGARSDDTTGPGASGCWVLSVLCVRVHA